MSDPPGSDEMIAAYNLLRTAENAISDECIVGKKLRLVRRALAKLMELYGVGLLLRPEE